ncbi:hypothetical protein QYE76_006969 [Lolium multiflorum]|uniref:Uncharacterized protein n=1 Tax=Lolium multiflorum TaxID=4521 RepID=A0AAD8RY45_LOLMU|nr:hypothetical protein QYE76_006969 [Lolium multiflorum]
MFLSLIIPGPDYPGKNLSVYMQPIVEDLNHSWHHGTLTYDRASKTNFYMKVWLQYTMHDMPGEFTDEMWPYDELPQPSEMDALLKEGAPGINKNFVSWFMEKALMISLSTGTPPPAQVPMAGELPIMPSRATFAMAYYGSTPVSSLPNR